MTRIYQGDRGLIQMSKTQKIQNKVAESNQQCYGELEIRPLKTGPEPK